MTGLFAAPMKRDVVRVCGPDAMTFLQGQLSQDVDALAVGTATWTFVLQPQGKVDGWARITRTANECFCLDTDAGHGDALEARLRRFAIRTDIDMERFEEPALAVRGHGAPRDDHLPDGVLRLPVVGPGVEGYDLLGTSSPPEGVDDAAPEQYEAYRIAHGVPAAGAELDEDTIPAEVGQWIVDSSVSFTKGCFVGQELVARIDSRGGNVPRHLRVVVMDEPADVGTPVEADGPPSRLTSAVVSPVHGPIGLAYLGRRVEPGATVRIGTRTAVVHEAPLDEGG